MTNEMDVPAKKPRKRRAARRGPGPRLGVNYIKPVSTAIIFRPEHYYMARELADYYETPLMRLAGALVVREYCKVLALSDPDGSAAIAETYAEDGIYSEHVTKLSD
jgi:hypothetical protein